MPTRNPVKNWFLTFPTWEQKSTRSEILELICQIIDPNEYGICRESHKDGSIHYHAMLKTDGITHSQMLKGVKQFIPKDWKRVHFKPIRSWNATLKYIKKEDTEPLLSPGCMAKEFVKNIMTAKKYMLIMRRINDAFTQTLAKEIKLLIAVGEIKAHEKIPENILSRIIEKYNRT